jgi:hypothetical protein
MAPCPDICLVSRHTNDILGGYVQEGPTSPSHYPLHRASAHTPLNVLKTGMEKKLTPQNRRRWRSKWVYTPVTTQFSVLYLSLLRPRRCLWGYLVFCSMELTGQGMYKGEFHGPRPNGGFQLVGLGVCLLFLLWSAYILEFGIAGNSWFQWGLQLRLVVALFLSTSSSVYRSTGFQGYTRRYYGSGQPSPSHVGLELPPYHWTSPPGLPLTPGSIRPPQKPGFLVLRLVCGLRWN